MAATTKVLLKKRQCTLKVGALVSSPNTTNTLYDQITDSVSGGITTWMEEATITYPEGAVNKVDYHGEDSAGFQNQSLEEDSWGVAKASLTFTFSPVDADLHPAAIFGSGSGTAVTSGEKRFQYGGSTAANLRVAKGIGFEFTDGTKIIDIGFNNAFASVKEVSLTGNRWRVTVELQCLSKDFYDEVQA